MDSVVFDELDQIVVYPVQDETHWTDGEGKVLPDAFVLQRALKPRRCSKHTDLGDGFIKGIDGRTKRVVGADHELADGDVLKIHSKSRYNFPSFRLCRFFFARGAQYSD